MARCFRDPVAALNDLLDVAERQPDRTRNLIYPDYQSMTSDTERADFHRVIEEAEAVLAVTVRRDRRAGPADIRFVSLADPPLLARFLRRVPATDKAATAIATLRQQVEPLPDWIAVILSDIAKAWAVRAEPYPGLAPDDVSTAAKFLRVLVAIDRGDHLFGWDMRTFSRRTCGDSKAVEAGMARLARALRVRFGLPDAKPREVLAALGIEKFPWPVLIRGCLALPCGTVMSARPYLGLPPEWASTFQILLPAGYVLTVENLASFNRHAREVDDDGVVVFSGGFPSRAVLAAIKRLDRLLPAAVPFFHWGDTDWHGRLIFEHIGRAIERPLHMHLMDGVASEQEETDPCPPAIDGFGGQAQA
jgi:hypothetical protein